MEQARSIKRKDSNAGGVLLAYHRDQYGDTERIMLDEATAISEFQHRVANDLALVAAVLARRRYRLQVVSADEVLEEAVSAIASLALIYKSLHEQPCNDDIVDVARHLTTVCSRMETGYLAGLDVVLHVRAPVALAPSRIAHDLALIVMELVGNAARHGDARRIGVALATDDERWTCSVVDDGSGLPADFTPSTRGGLSYVGRIAAGIHGQLTVASTCKGGTHIQVCFPAPGTH